VALFDPNPPAACAAFKNLRSTDSEHGVAAREHCENLWSDFAPFADVNFAAEFPLRLHERWFEMYLTVSLIRAGYNVQCPKPGPDVLVTINGRGLWIEATCATSGEMGLPDSVPAPVYAKEGEPGEFRDVPKDQRVLRIRNSLHTKAGVVSRYRREGIVPAGDAVAIAINVHDVPWLWTDIDEYMQRSLYGLGDLMVAIDQKTLKVVETRRQQVSHVVKSNKAEVGVQPFIDGDGSMPDVSAVLAAGADCGNLRKYLGQDFVLFPNLTAAVPWHTGAIRLGNEWTFAKAEDGWTGNSTSYPARR
jgi:hypothetical protein